LEAAGHMFTVWATGILPPVLGSGCGAMEAAVVTGGASVSKHVPS
jgi:hypothetical protein